MKSKNRILFLLIFVAIAGLFFISWQGFGEGHLLSYRNIDKGLDLSGGVYIVYEAQEENNTAKKDLEESTTLEEDLEENANVEENTNVEENSNTEETSSVEEISSQETTISESTEETETIEELGEPSWEDKMRSAMSMIQQRLDRKGWTEANVYQEGKNRIRVEIPGIEDAETAVQEIGQTAKLTFTDITGNVLVEGKDVVNASKAAITNQAGVQEIVVNLEFNEKGKKDFAKATEENIGNPILIMLDDNLISSPIVNTAITDGNAMISGEFDIDSAEELASLIRAGSLPFELEILEMNTVGATLGANALQTSILGGAVGLVLVLIFMILFYRMNGFAANLALIIYILVELILLNFFNITLTLHGIAGIMLSIGMAVDANVIIFERIREELKTGRTIKLAINKGFSRALPAILDSNITTLIAGGVLYWLGTGPIKGFAQTLMLGIVISMVTALFVTRIILNIMVGAGIKNPKLYGGR
ncbi:MAG: protein translocase subunit SecD [Eubacteriales bacterium]|nr:protein translocase subunit SecD [Eubacteriales bacterium]